MALSEVVQRIMAHPGGDGLFLLPPPAKSRLSSLSIGRASRPRCTTAPRFDVYKQALEVLDAVHYEPESGFPVVDSLLADEIMEAYQELEEE